MNKPYDHKEIESKWAKRWEKEGTFRTDVENAKNPYYFLMMFPYPSAEGLHAGHVFAYGGADTYGHMKLRQGLDVLEPMGFDSFGIHSENFAIKRNIQPRDLITKTVTYFRDEQFKRLGTIIDWDYEIVSSDPSYYKWTQWLFLQLYRAGLAYRKEASAQWCPSCLTVLADEQVIGGHCERCDAEVTTRTLPQWFFRITDYADRLLANLEHIDWPETTKTMQRNWIGKSEGSEVSFRVESGEEIFVYTTRPDTLWGATFVAVSPEHPLVSELTKLEREEAVQSYVRRASQKSEVERMAGGKDKAGVFTGSYAVNPVNGQKVPIWVADYVLMGYGTGAIMAVPGHDQRDWDFAKKYGLPVVEVISGGDVTKGAYVGEGTLMNSAEFTGVGSKDAVKKVAEYLEDRGIGRSKVTYHLRDWLISRQRYWGPPIPIIYCDKCGVVPVPEEQLPVLLPEVEDFKPTGTGKSPLAGVESFVNTTCPNCGGSGKRETDVSDTFLDSSWYFLRYPSVKFYDKPFDEILTKKWLPVDFYSGGNEHAVLHLLYARFVTMALKDLGFIDFEEPFTKFRARGMVIYHGAKMSKSRGNVINPNDYFEKVGADIFKTAMLFMVPFEQGGEFKDEGVGGIMRYFGRVVNLVDQVDKREQTLEEVRAEQLAIKRVTADIEQLSFNTAIAALMEYSNSLSKAPKPPKSGVRTLVSLLAPFAPHLAEELWERLEESFSVHKLAWPTYDERLLKSEQDLIVVQVNGKLRDKLTVSAGSSEEDVKRLSLDSPKVSTYTGNATVDRVVFVPGKLINFVLKSEG
jgi:leucyl-tRNA synthetase